MNNRIDKGEYYDHIYTLNPKAPMRATEPAVWSVWSDLFHKSVPTALIVSVLEIIAHCKQHRFIIRTKKTERIQSVLYGKAGDYFLGGGDYIPNVILMAVVEDQADADKSIPVLLQNDHFKLALSIEPMLGPIDLLQSMDVAINKEIPTVDGIGRWLSWVVIGCESGPKRRSMDIEWARDMVRQCKAAGIPVFVRQLDINGKVSKKMEEWPEDMRIRQIPQILKQGEGQ